jgi:hypothetical protein
MGVDIQSLGKDLKTWISNIHMISKMGVKILIATKIAFGFFGVVHSMMNSGLLVVQSALGAIQIF